MVDFQSKQRKLKCTRRYPTSERPSSFKVRRLVSSVIADKDTLIFRVRFLASSDPFGVTSRGECSEPVVASTFVDHVLCESGDAVTCEVEFFGGLKVLVMPYYTTHTLNETYIIAKVNASYPRTADTHAFIYRSTARSFNFVQVLDAVLDVLLLSLVPRLACNGDVIETAL